MIARTYQNGVLIKEQHIIDMGRISSQGFKDAIKNLKQNKK